MFHNQDILLKYTSVLKFIFYLKLIDRFMDWNSIYLKKKW